MTLPRTQTQWIKVLGRNGWRQQAGGKHQVKMTKPGRRPVTLPDNHRRAYSRGFEAQLRRETGLDRGDYPTGSHARLPRETGLER